MAITFLVHTNKAGSTLCVARNKSNEELLADLVKIIENPVHKHKIQMLWLTSCFKLIISCSCCLLLIKQLVQSSLSVVNDVNELPIGVGQQEKT